MVDEHAGDSVRITPESMRWNDEGHAEILWSDGHHAVYSPEHLRAICPCAHCKGTHGGPPKAFNILTSSQVAGATKQTRIDRVEPVGHYAIAFTWGDGHKDGIYTWTYLRAESPAASK